jgi:hypothetical protein
MLLRRRKQNERDTGVTRMPHNRDALATGLASSMISFFLCSLRHLAVKPGRPSSEFARVEACSYPHLYRGGVEHDADHGTERLGGEVVLELCADDAGVACRW